MKRTKHSKSRKGDLAEYYAVTWLWDQGYEVFLNAGCTGPVDMIATKNNEVKLIDVKTFGYGNSNTGGQRTEKQKELDVQLIGFDTITRELRFVEHKDEQPS